MTENYAQPGKEGITIAVDRLQQDVWTAVVKLLNSSLHSLLKPSQRCFSKSQNQNIHNTDEEVGWTTWILPTFCHSSSSAVAATAPMTGWWVCTLHQVRQEIGWCLTAAVNPSFLIVARETIPPTSTRWRSVHCPVSLHASWQVFYLWA